jgi:RNA polymerase sigma-70 factor, ECF subfamily
MSKRTETVVADSFDEVILPHLDAAYRLARWLVGNEHDAEDVVQEASLRAFRYFRTFSGRNGRAWFLRIVRNTCWSWHGQRAKAPTDHFDEEQHSDGRLTLDPETLLLHADDASLIDRTLKSLSDRFRELLVLRELEGLSYQELADVLGIPIGTVMSGLSRARQAFRGALEVQMQRSRMPWTAESRARQPVTSHAVSADAGTPYRALESVDRVTAGRTDLAQKEDL